MLLEILFSFLSSKLIYSSLKCSLRPRLDAIAGGCWCNTCSMQNTFVWPAVHHFICAAPRKSDASQTCCCHPANHHHPQNDAVSMCIERERIPMLLLLWEVCAEVWWFLAIFRVCVWWFWDGFAVFWCGARGVKMSVTRIIILAEASALVTCNTHSDDRLSSQLTYNNWIARWQQTHTHTETYIQFGHTCALWPRIYCVN